MTNSKTVKMIEEVRMVSQLNEISRVVKRAMFLRRYLRHLGHAATEDEEVIIDDEGKVHLHHHHFSRQYKSDFRLSLLVGITTQDGWIRFSLERESDPKPLGDGEALVQLQYSYGFDVWELCSDVEEGLEELLGKRAYAEFSRWWLKPLSKKRVKEIVDLIVFCFEGFSDRL